MKLAILSDTHDNVVNLRKVIDFLNAEKFTTAIHCGDVCNRATIHEATSLFTGEMLFVRGNGDYDLEELPQQAALERGGKKIGWVHYPDIARQMALSKKYDAVFYGHTHKPWEETVEGCRLVNPGELAGQRFRPTFAIYDLERDSLELKMVDRLV